MPTAQHIKLVAQDFLSPPLDNPLRRPARQCHSLAATASELANLGLHTQPDLPCCCQPMLTASEPHAQATTVLTTRHSAHAPLPQERSRTLWAAANYSRCYSLHHGTGLLGQYCRSASCPCQIAARAAPAQIPPFLSLPETCQLPTTPTSWPAVQLCSPAL